jgi:hypothetical protein
VGKRVAAIALPRPLMMAGAHLDRLVRGKGAKLTPDRVAYFCHQDWVIDAPARSARRWAICGTPQVETNAGLGGDGGLVSPAGAALNGPSSTILLR